VAVRDGKELKQGSGVGESDELKNKGGTDRMERN